MSAKLDALKKRETWVLTPAEQARLAALRTREFVKVARDKDTSKVDAKVAAIWETAEERIRAEEAAREKVAQEKRDAKVRTRAERKAARGWW